MPFFKTTKGASTAFKWLSAAGKEGHQARNDDPKRTLNVSTIKDDKEEGESDEKYLDAEVDTTSDTLHIQNLNNKDMNLPLYEVALSDEDASVRCLTPELALITSRPMRRMDYHAGPFEQRSGNSWVTSRPLRHGCPCVYRCLVQVETSKLMFFPMKFDLILG